MRLAVFYLLLVVAQGWLTGLFGTLPAPDLFLLAGLTLLGRAMPWQLVLIAFGIGLLQDVMGFGPLGVHALGLAVAVWAAMVVRAQFSRSGVAERLLIVSAAQGAKWLVTVTLWTWLSGAPTVPVLTLAVAVSETVLTAGVSLLIVPWGEALLDRAKVARREFV